METFSFFPGSIIPVTVNSDPQAHRIDTFLSNTFPNHSRSFFQKLIDQQCIQLNNRIVAKPSASLKTGDLITITMPPEESSTIPKECPQEITVKSIFEHPDFLIIEKPAHLVVHKPATSSQDYTLVDWLLAHFNEIKQVGAYDRPGIVHRLDKDTSGLMIIARNNPAHAQFNTNFKDRAIKKTYRALVQGHPKPSGSINLPIGRDPFVPIRMSHRSMNGRPALTHYRVEKYFDNCALIELKPVTGRTHQLRVHCAAIGHPIIGDAVYGTPSKLIDRQTLHASSLSFSFDGTSYEFFSELPTDFQNIISMIEQNTVKVF